MKNPFKKSDHRALVGGIIVGSALVGTALYLLLTETGASVRGQIAGHFKRLKDSYSGHEPETASEHTKDYLQHKKKAPKTDREKLLKHEILNVGPSGESPAEQNNQQ